MKFALKPYHFPRRLVFLGATLLSLLAVLLVSPLATVLSPPALAQTPLTLEDVAKDGLWFGPAVWSSWWSADAQALYYKVGRKFSPDSVTYRLDRRTNATAEVAQADLATLDGAELHYDRDRTRALFVSDDGNLFLRQLSSGTLTQLTDSPEFEASPMFSADGRQVFFQRDYDWFAWNADGAIAPVLRLKAENAPPTPAANTTYLGDQVEVYTSSLSPDGRHALVITIPKAFDRGQPILMPRYLTESGYPDLEDIGGTRVGSPEPPQTVWLVDAQQQTVQPLDLSGLPGINQNPLAAMRAAQDLPPLVGNRPINQIEIAWNLDGTRVAANLWTSDHKDIWLFEVAPDTAAITLRHRETDRAKVYVEAFGFLADNALWFISEQSGYKALYVDEGDGAKAIASGNFEIFKVQWSHPGTQAYFMCNREWPGDWEVCRVNRDGSDLREMTALDGVGDSLGILTTYRLSPDDSQLAVHYSSTYLPLQLALVDAQTGDTRKLTDTRSEALKAGDWIQPEFVQIPSTHFDGVIWGKLYRPAEMAKGQKYPLVIILHGGSGLQAVKANAGIGPKNELMFSNLLVQQGYLVMEIDFRSSLGYGRDFNNGNYLRVGLAEVEDMRDSVDFLVDQYQGDRDRAGVMGASYSGYLSYMAMLLAPDVFKAGIAECGYSDWKLGVGSTTGAIFLEAPELNPEGYAESSPVTHAGDLEGRLLIVHGVVDSNVTFEHAVHMTQRLIDEGSQNWEIMPYPTENHCPGSTSEIRLDKYGRIFKLFEETLESPS